MSARTWVTNAQLARFNSMRRRRRQPSWLAGEFWRGLGLLAVGGLVTWLWLVMVTPR